MKRDMDLLRSLLLEVEKLPFVAGGYSTGVKVPGFSDEEVCYHAKLADEQGLIDAKFLPGTTDFMVQRLTYEGHEFLDAARSDTMWNKAKATVMKNAGTLT